MSSSRPGSEDASERVRVNPVVFFGSGTVIVLLAIWAIFDPEGADTTIGITVAWISERFGWFYILIAAAFLGFILFLALSRYGSIKLGPDDSQPSFNLFTWAAMLFAAGIGTDVMFFSVAEPVAQYLEPPTGDGETIETARQATTWMLFHYGTMGWAMYALMGISLGYFAYRRGLPLSVRSCLYPLFGQRIYGTLGHGIDIAAILGTIFGIATSLGISVVQLNVGLDMLFGIPEGFAAQIGLVAVTVIAATLSAVSGVGRGIRRLSEINVILTLALSAFILISGETIFLLNAFVLDINDYLSSFIGMAMDTFAFEQPTEWLNSWTLFFWAWWVAWAAFIGLFLARISRGRTIRQFVAGTLIIPFLYILMWTSIFGNSAIKLIRNGHEHFGQLTLEQPEQGFYTLLTYFPGFTVIAAVATLVGMLFYITSADSGALVMGNLSSHLKGSQDEASIPVRIFWAMATGLLTLAMLLVDGIETLQNATIIMGLPFAFVMVLLMIGLFRSLHADILTIDSTRRSWPMLLSARVGRATSMASATMNWRTRLDQVLSTPSRERVLQYLGQEVPQALGDVQQALSEHSIECQLQNASDDAEQPFVTLALYRDSDEPFIYRIELTQVIEADPLHPGQEGSGSFCQLNVVLRNGGQGYDVMGYSQEQLIHDVLDQYRKYQEYLRLRL